MRAIWYLKHTSHTGEHSLIPTKGRDGLGVRLHRQVARTMTIADPILEIEAMLTLCTWKWFVCPHLLT